MQAGDFTTLVVLSGSFLRPVGGWLADKFGGYRLLMALFACIAACLVVVGALPPIALVVPMLFLSMGMLGMGNGAIFQMAPQRFTADIELITGIVGAAGGLDGFFLPSILGALKDISGSHGMGLMCFAGLMAVSVLLLLEFGVQWNSTWTAAAMSRTQVFSYRKARGPKMPMSVFAYEGDPAGD